MLACVTNMRQSSSRVNNTYSPLGLCDTFYLPENLLAQTIHDKAILAKCVITLSHAKIYLVYMALLLDQTGMSILVHAQI